MPEANSFSDAGPDLWHCLGWQPNDTQLSQLKELQVLLRDWNSRVNLTRLVENEEFWIAQVFDSLWPLEHELSTPDLTRRCIDVGTGGGFPGLAVAIAQVLMIQYMLEVQFILLQVRVQVLLEMLLDMLELQEQ